MKRFSLLVLLILSTILHSCDQNSLPEDPSAKAQAVVDRAIEFHGMEKLGNAGFELMFRDYKYTYENKQGKYTYTRAFTDSIGASIFDVLTNDGLIRYTEGQETNVEEEKRAAYARSVNSVIYFFRLPYGLNDDAVLKSYEGITSIKGQDYHEIKISFEQDGGGEDFDDVFLYWFAVDDFSMDYLAYLYHTDGGGLRFREAINQRRVEGMLIQDYINFKPEDESMPIGDLTEMYENGALEELSRIINEQIEISTY